MPPAQARAKLSVMVQSMMHESFYNSRTWTEESLGVYAGSVERKGSYSDDELIRNEESNCTLLLSGEEFSSPRASLTQQIGGSQFLANLNGWFHGLLADHARGTVTLFN